VSNIPAQQSLFVNDVKDGVYLFDQDEATIEFTG
jgi:aminopeptidase N